MSKIICDICGTTYSDTEEQCPICGCAREARLEDTANLAEEEINEAPRAKGGRFAAANVSKRGSKKSVYVEEDDDDEDEYEDDEDEYYDYDDDDDEDDHKSNAPLIVLLVVVIVALLAVTGFIFVKYFLPNMQPEETTAPTVATTTEAPTETTELRIPCTDLAMTSGGTVELTEEGQNWLINVLALPENTTDPITYVSSDVLVATVNEQGKITAVGEGTAVITITCGEFSLTCTVTVDFDGGETTAPTEETTEPTEETTEPTEPLKDIVLKVSLTDITFNAKGQGYTFSVQGLRNDEVKWTSLDENIVKVDENGSVISVGPGTTKIICQYGNQKVEITIRCKW